MQRCLEVHLLASIGTQFNLHDVNVPGMLLRQLLQ
jgi:hypothetical protein